MLIAIQMHLNHLERVQVPGIKVCAVDQEVQLPRTYDEAPIFGEQNVHAGDTYGHEGGHSKAGGPEYNGQQARPEEVCDDEKKRGCCGCVNM